MFLSTVFSKAKAAKAILAGCLALLSASAFAQGNLTITGTVREATGEPVVGAGVLVAGTPSGTVTDMDGTYRLTGVQRNAVITVTAIGFKTIEEPVHFVLIIRQLTNCIRNRSSGKFTVALDVVNSHKDRITAKHVIRIGPVLLNTKTPTLQVMDLYLLGYLSDNRTIWYCLISYNCAGISSKLVVFQ
jgi:hypothetical protein